MKSTLLKTIALSFIFISVNSYAENLNIDISGSDGLPPKDGTCCVLYPRTNSQNQTPKSGEDARPGTPGVFANNLDLKLRDTEDLNGAIVVYGTVYNQGNGRVSSIINEKISLSSSIFINAEGGNGARGGKGGQGQDGCDGDDGVDADDENDGTDGDDGCNSGGGGDASSAQDGGDGGQVRVFIPVNQTHLALLVNASVEGGQGGAPGIVGQPGDPGRGGNGGSSHRYIDYYVDEPACSSSNGGSDYNGGGSNDLGNGYDSFESDASPYIIDLLKDTTQVAGHILNELVGVSPAYACGGRNPVYATNSGGSDGRNGISGPLGRGDTSPGEDGDNGDFEFIVVEANGRETSYRKPFDLQLLSYDLRDSAPGGNEDGVFEPNEILTISRLRIKNISQMPSPKMADVVLSVQTANWLIANPVDRVLVPALNGGQETTLRDVFFVKVKNAFTAGNNQAWSVSDTIVPRGSVPRIKRTIEGLTLPKTVHMSFPVEITPIQSVAVIGPGETAAIQWRVTNTSNRNFMGLNGAIRRLQTTLLRIGGDAPRNTISNINIGLDEDNLSGSFLRTITELRAQESVIISGSIDFSIESEPYTSVDIQSSLGLEILGTTEMTTIMNQSHRITISQTYKYTPGASVLLLTHSKTTRQEYKAWMQVFESLGLKADVWDISYNRDLNLVRDLSGNQQGSSLLKNYRGKTIILLNGDMPDQRNQQSLRLLNRSQFYQAASENNINFYILGGETDDLTSELVGMHLDPNALERTAASKDTFLRAIESGSLSSGPISLANASQLTYQELHQSLVQNPQSKFSLVFNKSGNTTRLVLYPSLSQLSGSMIAQPATSREKSAPQFIQSEKNLRPFILSLSTEDKIKSFKTVLQSGNTTNFPSVTSALIHDLIESYYAFKTSDDETSKARHLSQLQAFSKSIDGLRLHPNSNEYLGRVSAALSFFAEVSSETSLKLFSSNLTKKLDEPTKKYYQKYLESYRKFSEQRQSALRANYEKIFDTYKMFTLPAIGRSITSGNMLFIKSSVVMTGDLQ